MALLLLSGVLLLAALGDRPLHTDEAVNARIAGNVLADGRFHYDPTDRHGPSYHALLAGICWLGGARDFASLNEFLLRLSAVVSALLILPGFWLLGRDIGVLTALFGAFLWSLQPSAVYFARYAIHESLLITFTVLFLACGFATLRTKSWRWAVGCGASCGCMFATKETALLPAGAALVATLLCYRSTLDRSLLPCAAAFLGALLAVIIVAFSWGFTWLPGITDFLGSYPGYFQRASDPGFAAPFYYYLQLAVVAPSSWFLLLFALVGTVQAFRCPGPMRWIAVFAALSWLGCSAISYKTPWLFLNLLLPLCILAGAGSVWVFQNARIVFLAAFALLIAISVPDLRRLVFIRPENERNPFAYSHTVRDLLRLPTLVDKIALDLGHPPTIGVIAADPWPIPWYLRHFPKTGFWRPGSAIPEVDILILDQAESNRLEPALTHRRPFIFGQRPGVLLLLFAPPTP